MKPDRMAVSNEAKGRVRALCVQLDQDAARVTAAAQALPLPMVRAALSRHSLDSRRGMRNIQRRMPVGPIWQAQRQCAWRFLRPLGDQIEVAVVLLGASNRKPISIESFGLKVTSHAICRLLDRTAFTADPANSVLSAHDALLKFEPIDGARLFSLANLRLPSPGGCFLCAPVAMADGAPMLLAQTWVSRDQLFDDQDRDLTAWGNFLSTDFAMEVRCDEDYSHREKHRKSQEVL